MNSDMSINRSPGAVDRKMYPLNNESNNLTRKQMSSEEKPSTESLLFKSGNGGASIGEEQLTRAIERALQALQGPHTTFEVSMHKETNSIMVKVLNKETGELIREIPREKTLDLVAKMMEFAGILIDKRV